MFEPFFTERKVLIEIQNRVAIHSNNLGDKSDFRSFKILQLKCKTLSRNNATLPGKSCSKIVTGLKGSKTDFRLALEITPLNWSAVAPSLGADFFHPALCLGLEGCSPLTPVVRGCSTSSGRVCGSHW